LRIAGRKLQPQLVQMKTISDHCVPR